MVSQDKNSKVKEPLLSKKELISFLKEMLLAEDLFFFYNPTKTYISKEEIRKELKKAPEYTEELYRRYADKLIVEQMFEKEPLTDAAVQKMDFLLNYDMFKILPDIEERLAVYDILESHDEWSKVNFGPYEKKLSSKDKGWIIAAYNTIRMGTSVGDIITGLTVEGLSSVTNYFAAKSSNAFNALQKMEEVDKYFKEEFLQGAEYSKEIKEFYVSNNKALEAANAIGIRDGKGTEGTGKLKTTPELEAHIKNADPAVPRSRGIGGAHNSEEFFKNDIKVVTRTPHPSVKGVEIVEYQMPKLDKTGTPIPGEYQSGRPFTKSIYDPKVISDEVFVNRGIEAANNALSNSADGILPRIWSGVDSHGVTWRGYFENGSITSFYPE